MYGISPKDNHQILIIDDNPAIHDDIKQILGRTGSSELEDVSAALFGESAPSPARLRYDIDSAYQGLEGLEKVIAALQNQRPYAVGFVDMRMPPGWDGLETIEHLWQADPDLQIVICTAYSDHSWAEISTRLGATDQLLILKKPFDVTEVRQLAAALTRKWNLARQVRQQLDELEAAVAARTYQLEQQQQELERTHTRLLHAQKMESIGQLAAGIAHEINTPTQYVSDNTAFLKRAFGGVMEALQSAQTLLTAVQEGTLAPGVVEQAQSTFKKAKVDFLLKQVPRALEQSLEGLGRVAHIVSAMKEFSHPSQGEKQCVDLGAAIATTLTVARNEWKYVAEAVTDFDPSLPPVPCLRDEFNQVILNLVVNAAHAISDVTDGGNQGMGTITLTTQRDGAWAEIRVRDTGTGIPEPIRQKIFDPFFTTKPVGKGTGQGLAIAHAVIVDKHGGTLDVESEVGTGTTFIIRLPLNDAPIHELGTTA